MDNILLIRLKAIGDVIFTLPAVAALHGHFPGARITFLTSKENATLLSGFPQVNQVIPLDRDAFRGGNPFKITAELGSLLWALRRGRFGLTVDFQGFGETALLARLTGARQRWGSVYGKGRSWAYTHGLVREEQIHPADWNLQLIRRCGVAAPSVRNEFHLPDDALAAARKFFADNSLDPGKPTLVIQPFTSTPQKNWPLENFLTVARHWSQRGLQIIFIGGKADHARLDGLRTQKFCVATGLPLLVSGGLAQMSHLTLGGDTGLGHLAVALGRRVVMLMMHRQPGACVPFLHPEWAVVPDPPGLMANITIQHVLNETAKVLAAA